MNVIDVIKPVLYNIIFHIVNSEPHDNSANWYHVVLVCRLFKKVGYRRSIRRRVKKLECRVTKTVTLSGLILGVWRLAAGHRETNESFDVVHTRWRRREGTYAVGERVDTGVSVYMLMIDCEGTPSGLEVAHQVDTEVLVHPGDDVSFYLGPDNEALMY